MPYHLLSTWYHYTNSAAGRTVFLLRVFHMRTSMLFHFSHAVCFSIWSVYIRINSWFSTWTAIHFGRPLSGIQPRHYARSAPSIFDSAAINRKIIQWINTHYHMKGRYIRRFHDSFFKKAKLTRIKYESRYITYKGIKI